MSFIVAFITGLTAGGFGCLALHGGLLTTALGIRLQRDRSADGGCVGASAGSTVRQGLTVAVILFLIAKLAAYTAVGFLLGACGSVVHVSPAARAVLLVVIGLFIIGNALRMLDLHPVFRWFAVEPPSFVARMVRRTARGGTRFVTPVFLGALTVLLPCGVAQAMMAAALASGAPFQGAALLFSFTLGTMPLFVAAILCAATLQAVTARLFTRAVALAMLLLGLFSVVDGVNLAGFSLPRHAGVITPAAVAAPTAQQAASAPANVVTVSERGYLPQVLHLAAGRPATLVWSTSGAVSCAQSIVVPALNYQVDLPLRGEVRLPIPAQRKGTVINYSCSMGMYTGRLLFDLP